MWPGITVCNSRNWPSLQSWGSVKVFILWSLTVQLCLRPSTISWMLKKAENVYKKQFFLFEIKSNEGASLSATLKLLQIKSTRSNMACNVVLPKIIYSPPPKPGFFTHPPNSTRPGALRTFYFFIGDKKHENVNLCKPFIKPIYRQNNLLRTNPTKWHTQTICHCCRQNIWVCLTIFWGWRLIGQKVNEVIRKK